MLSSLVPTEQPLGLPLTDPRFSLPLASAAWHFLFLQDKDSTKLLLES